MTPEQIITALLAVVTAGVGWWVKNIWAMVISQQQQITQLHLKVAESYVPKTEFREALDRILNKLDEIQKEVKQ